MNKKGWIYIFVSILVLTAFSSIYSLISNSSYLLDSQMIRAKCHYLDIFNISIVVPLGVLLTIHSLKNVYWAKLAVIGVSSYLLYMAGFSSLSLKFNKLFLINIAVFGLSIFCSVLGYIDVFEKGKGLASKFIKRVSSAYLFLFALIPGTAWIIEIVHSVINNSIPNHNLDMNISVNVVHVFDLAFVLPLIIISGVELIKGRKTGVISSFIAVVFILLTCIAILIMEIGLINERLNIDAGQFYSMFILIPLGLLPLSLLFKEVKR